MMTTATHNEHYTATHATEPVLFLAFELSETTWKLGCTTGHGQNPRERSIAARHQARLLQAVAQAKRRCGLSEPAPVVRCDAAGREGVGRHRCLQGQGLTNHVVDSSSIEVNRRQRRAKSEALDVGKWLSLLTCSHQGERQVGRVRVPSVDAEALRHVHRDLEPVKQARASTTACIKGLLSSQGIRLTRVNKLPEPLDALRLWDGSPLPGGLRRRVLRGDAHAQFLRAQIAELAAERRALRGISQESHIEKVRQLLHLRGIGINGSWLLVMEFFGWRELTTRREGGGFAGGTPTPYHSGARAREQGITKSGNLHGRWRTTELAGSWVRYQPESARSGWFRDRFGGGGKRWRRLGIVAVARKLLIALWCCLETGGLPEGAVRQEA
jgi:transposase